MIILTVKIIMAVLLASALLSINVIVHEEIHYRHYIAHKQHARLAVGYGKVIFTKHKGEPDEKVYRLIPFRGEVVCHNVPAGIKIANIILTNAYTGIYGLILFSLSSAVIRTTFSFVMIAIMFAGFVCMIEAVANLIPITFDGYNLWKSIMQVARQKRTA